MIPIAKPWIGNEEIDAVRRVMEGGILAQGEQVAELEKKFSEYIGARHAIAVGNGTQALHLVYAALGFKAGSEFVVPDMTFAATATPLLHLGFKPVFADIEPKYFSLDASQVKKLVSKTTRAIVPVHLYGHPADISELSEVAKEHDLALIEDACQAHGAQFNGKRVGSFGVAATFSFYPTKNMTTGEGGMITTNSDELAETCRMTRDHGQKPVYTHSVLGHNFRMTNIAAAIGIEQLKKLDRMNDGRRKNAALYNEMLSSVVGTPPEAQWARHVYHQYTMRVPKGRDDLMKHLGQAGIGARIYYPIPLSEQPILKGFRKGKNVETAKAAGEVLSIPVYPSLPEADIKLIASKIKEWMAKQ
ncbi:MAG: DegT/DnrJ/EryC1/StrS family aminotransferase [Euryarchaeota archaeon]|nr:DegT/DnrJ/EryC1/StrS family aminotransferase [Euryarchaeota archaeon]